MFAVEEIHCKTPVHFFKDMQRCGTYAVVRQLHETRITNITQKNKMAAGAFGALGIMGATEMCSPRMSSVHFLHVGTVV